eukprot:8817698-Pyramimonas_sp.AAC.1
MAQWQWLHGGVPVEPVTQRLLQHGSTATARWPHGHGLTRTTWPDGHIVPAPRPQNAITQGRGITAPWQCLHGNIAMTPRSQCHGPTSWPLQSDPIDIAKWTIYSLASLPLRCSPVA